MMGPILFPQPGSENGTVYDDTYIRQRIDDTDAEVASLKTTKANAGTVTAVANRVTALEGRRSGAVTLRVPEDHATISLAIASIKGARADQGTRWTLDVAPGVYDDTPDLDCPNTRIVHRAPGDIVTPSTTYLESTAQYDHRYHCEMTAAQAATFQIGDAVSCDYAPGVTADLRHAAICGGVRVVGKGPTWIVLHYRTFYAPWVDNPAGVRIHRPSVQIRTSAPIVVEREMISTEGVAIAPKLADSSQYGDFILLVIGSEAVLRLPKRSGRTERADLVVVGGSLGIFVEAGARVTGGYVVTGSCRYEGLQIREGARVNIRRHMSCGADVAVFVFDGAQFNVGTYTYNRSNTVITGRGYGILAYRTAGISMNSAHLYGSQVYDVAAYLNTAVSCATVTIGSCTPQFGATGNRNSYIGD